MGRGVSGLSALKETNRLITLTTPDMGLPGKASSSISAVCPFTELANSNLVKVTFKPLPYRQKEGRFSRILIVFAFVDQASFDEPGGRCVDSVFS